MIRNNQTFFYIISHHINTCFLFNCVLHKFGNLFSAFQIPLFQIYPRSVVSNVFEYGPFFKKIWGGTRESIKVLCIQKKAIRLITGIKKYESCRQKFKENRIRMVTSLYVLFFILPFSPSSHKYDIGHVKFSLHSLHCIKNIHSQYT
jgi:hypothetical protein